MTNKPVIGTRVSYKTEELIKKAVEEGYYLTPSALFQASVLKELERIYPEERQNLG